MKNLRELDEYRVKHPYWPQTDTSGVFKVMVKQRAFVILASVDNIGEDGVWEHISVTPKNQKRCPTWDEMCAIKNMFFDPEEECVEFHPKASTYVNSNEYCLHIWRPANDNLRCPAENMATLRERDQALEQLWAEFADIPMNPETECIEEPFLSFPAGTHREEIWHWFDHRHSEGVVYLMYGGGPDYTVKASELMMMRQFCIECESKDCQFNHMGECRFALVHERKPRITDSDGCIDYDYREGCLKSDE